MAVAGVLMGLALWFWLYRDHRASMGSASALQDGGRGGSTSGMSSGDDPGIHPPATAKRTRHTPDAVHAKTPFEEERDILKENGGEVTNSVVHARVPVGHSVVMGGYPRPGGLREFVILTPKVVKGDKGNQVHILIQKYVLNPDGLRCSGLDSLVTDKKKTRQHAESWSPENLESTFSSLSEGIDPAPSAYKELLAETGGYFIHPQYGRETFLSVMAMSPGTPNAFFLGGENGVSQLSSLDLTAELTSDGGVDLTSDLRVHQSP